jgi:hypothetical protein
VGIFVRGFRFGSVAVVGRHIRRGGCVVRFVVLGRNGFGKISLSHRSSPFLQGPVVRFSNTGFQVINYLFIPALIIGPLFVAQSLGRMSEEKRNLSAEKFFRPNYFAIRLTNRPGETSKEVGGLLSRAICPKDKLVNKRSRAVLFFLRGLPNSHVNN